MGVIEALVIRLGHVRADRVRRNLPNAQILAVVWFDGAPIAVCVLKGDNSAHLASIVENSEYDLPRDSQELGYAVTDLPHQRRGLGTG
jgi:hypothetical protein